ncbi:MAG: P-loop NTPase, partial [Thermoleophilia bacterium]|nr:P-loop NTPase [Thermoleophilia bacterium]
AVPTKPVFPRPVLYVELAVVLGLLLGCGLALLISYYDRRLKDEADVRETLGVPVLASLPKISQGWARFGKRANSCAGFSGGCEALFDSVRTLRSTLKLVGVGKDLSSLLVTSALPGEGKSTVAIDLALAMALSGHRVVLVDADLRSPSVDQYLGLSNVRGMSEVLAGRVGWADVTQTLDVGKFMPGGYRVPGNPGQDKDGSTLLCLTSGNVPPNPSELLEAADLAGILEQ